MKDLIKPVLDIAQVDKHKPLIADKKQGNNDRGDDILL